SPATRPTASIRVQLDLDRRVATGIGRNAANAPIVNVNPHLTPQDFDISKTDYDMPRVPVVLLLPCSKRKPYSLSSTHRLVDKALRAASIPPNLVYKVTVSGN